MKRFNENAFLKNLSDQPWFLMDIYDDPDDSTQLFLDLFQKVLDKHAPHRKKRVKRVNQPSWINPDILQAIAVRDHYHKKKDSINYKIWRQHVKDLITESKMQFYNNTISLNKRNTKDLWNSFHDLTGFKTQTHTNYIDDENGNPITDPSKSANVLNDHFCSVFQTVQINNQDNNNNNETRILSERIEEKIKNTPHFAIPPVCVSFVEKQLQSLDTT